MENNYAEIKIPMNLKFIKRQRIDRQICFYHSINIQYTLPFSPETNNAVHPATVGFSFYKLKY